MILIIGGAYQGKEEFSRQQFGKDAQIIRDLEKFAWECCAEDPKARREAADEMRQKKDEWQDKILIITDVSQGIVPMDARTRAFREMNGRLMLYLASEADQVWRVFCGIGKRIK
ncbi:MAG: bifunctional adenosylcobinamide kinase/adenosylcobinamide-phosphate guanylyltransferase [Firmicutes bacterium]|nr:bifunctional adenosylcobinamide kinase/adenosylcobinamide-phosphate guanylyltransferase [Bacillota bacterium]